MTSDRFNELKLNVESVRSQIEQATRAAGRDAADVTPIAVSKTFPSSDALLLSQLGIRDLGENKAQDLQVKADDCQGAQIRWHFVGQLQRNKAKLVAEHAHWAHSIDRPNLVTALDRYVAEIDREPLGCLIQVNLDPEPTPGRGGITPKDARDLAELVAQSPHLILTGVMGVASRSVPAEQSFETLAAVHATIQQNHPQATAMSAGMSSDFPVAIAAGATHVRLGAALLGQRTYVR